MAIGNQTPSFDDEISLTDLVLKAWYRRGLVVVIPILAAMVSTCLVLFQATESKTPTVYFVNLTAIEKGFYPNGVQFSPQDLRSPDVLSALSERAGTGSLRDSITVSFASPVTKGILKKYEGKLAQRNINSTQIDALNADLQEELMRSTQRTLRISIDHQRLGLNSEQGAELAILLPQVWSEIYTTKYRILDNTKLSNAILPERVSLTSTLGIIEARTVIANILEALSTIERDNRLQSLAGKSGITPTDLRIQISSVNDIYLNGVLSENIAAGDALARVYLSDIILEIEKLSEELMGVEDAIESMQKIMSSSSAAREQTSETPPSRVQLSGNAIEDISVLINRATLGEYLTNLYERKAEMISARAELKFQIRKVEEGVGFGPELIAEAENNLNKLIDAYADILIRARELNRRTAGEMHHGLGSPFTIGSLVPPRAPLVVLLSFVIGVIIALVIALILPLRKRHTA